MATLTLETGFHLENPGLIPWLTKETDNAREFHLSHGRRCAGALDGGRRIPGATNHRPTGAAGQRQERRQGRRETSQAQQQQANAAAAWDQSYRGCLQKRGYVVTP